MSALQSPTIMRSSTNTTISNENQTPINSIISRTQKRKPGVSIYAKKKITHAPLFPQMIPN